MFKFKKIVVLVLLIQYFGLGAQNLVPNPSFETYSACPTGFSQISKAVPWNGTNVNSEFYNSCALGTVNVPNPTYGYQPARTGNGYAGQYFINGIGVNYREYIQVALTNSLITGNCYLVKFYVNCVNKIIRYACNNFAAHISVNSYGTAGLPAPYTPQIYLVNNPIVKDTLNWTEIGGIYTATGGENFITIGNFKNDANTDTLKMTNGTNGAAYYYIEDVSLEQIVAPTWQLKDTMIIGGDSVLIGPLYSGLTCNWFNMLGTPIGSGSAFWVKPATTTSYVLQQTFCNNTFSDTVTVFVSGLGIKENQNNSLIKLFPNPVSNTLFISTKKNEFENCEIEIINYLGQTVLKSAFKNELDVSQLSSGCYVLKLTGSNKQQFHSKFIKE